MKGRSAVALSLLIVLTALKPFDKKPDSYVIRDSSVQNNDGNGRNEYWGWGALLNPTRTFISGGRWSKILETSRLRDFMLMQFGHNDQAEINETARAKGTLKGTSEQVEDIFNLKQNNKK